jgi:hypothetical protein
MNEGRAPGAPASFSMNEGRNYGNRWRFMVYEQSSATRHALSARFSPLACRGIWVVDRTGPRPSEMIHGAFARPTSELGFRSLTALVGGIQSSSILRNNHQNIRGPLAERQTQGT